jgi:hypothetical protein
MQPVSRSKTTPPRLGIVLLDLPHLSGSTGSFVPADGAGLGTLPRGALECPATWPIPTEYEVARGATAEATLRGERAAAEGVRDAIAALQGRCDLIIGDCGFFWGARRHVDIESHVPVLLSVLDILDQVTASTDAPIGVLAFSRELLERMLDSHPARDRLRIVGLSDQPSWSRLEEEEYGLKQGWTTADLEAELDAVMAQSLGSRGALDDAGALLLECTLTPQFRATIRAGTALPLYDVAHLALAVLSDGGALRRLGSVETTERRANGR